MKKINKIIIYAILLSSLCLPCCAETKFEGMKYSMEEQMQMYQDRLSVLYIDAQRVGDMILGYKGILEFVMSDDDLAENLTSFTCLPNWYYDASYSFSNADMDKDMCFACRVTFSTLWNFDPLKIKIGDYQLQASDILSPSASNPFGEFPSGTEAYFVFRIPLSAVKGKTTVDISYENNKVTWKVVK